MKNYFESEDCIVPFEKVLKTVQLNYIDTKQIILRVFVEYKLFQDFSIDQLANYKDWLESQAEIIENQTFRKTFENYIKEKTKGMSKEEMFEYTNGNFYVQPKVPDGYVDYSDKFPFKTCSCSEKANDSNHLPDVGKMVLSREQVNEIINNKDCSKCRHRKKIDKEYRCTNNVYECEIDATDDFVKEINKLINEV